ncbi:MULTISPECIES: Cof-type HAD-IIB family hydrolase [Gracilibacillus]|uniref:Cof-type HAD-IIB family hydrolase n=1 Tax=Gracilibacillus TaxID=74385 RepID=UPI000825DCB3|nr:MULTISPECIES: Cof-type HAD-IIB family hydrolase [Gracilibacillus]
MRLIATDLDGTLLNEFHEISEANKEAIMEAKKRGIEVMVATGRSYSAAKKPLENAGLTCPILCLNGAKVYLENGDVFSSAPMTKKTCTQIQAICETHGIYFEAFTNQGGFAKDREAFIEVMVDIGATAFPHLNKKEIRAMATNRFQEEEITIIDDFTALFNQKEMEVYKILAFSLDNDILREVQHHFADGQQVAVTSSGESNLEFNHPLAQKGIALASYTEKQGIDMSEVMTIGDNYNDLSMLKMAGRGVAMGNAAPDIKAACDYVTVSNKENGVASAIKTMLAETKINHP